MLTFLQFKDRSALATNNLVMKSTRIEFSWDFKVDHRPPAAPKATPRVAEREVLAFAFSPEIYDIRSFSTNSTVMHANGIVLFLLRGPDGQGVVQAKEFATPTAYDVREIHTETVTLDKIRGCQLEYLNKQTQLKVTMDFEAATLTLKANDEVCLVHRLSQAAFPGRRATTTFFAYSTDNDPICVRFEEISVSKAVNLLTSADAAFTSSVAGLIASVRRMDPEHFRNASLSNIMLMDVG